MEDQEIGRSTRSHAPHTPEQRAKKQQSFLKFYRECANIKASCKAAGINRQTFYNWRDNDPEFAAQLPEADKEADDTAEFALYDRAVKGIESYVVSQGKIVYEDIPLLNKDGTPKLDQYGEQTYMHGKALKERKYSDGLLTTLLKARMPEKYKEKQQTEHIGPGGGPVQMRMDYSLLSTEDLLALEQLAKKAANGSSTASEKA